MYLWTTGIMYVIGLGCSLWLLRKAHRKRVKMVQPRVGIHYDETYCELSVTQLYVVQAYILDIMVLQALNLIKVLQG